VPRPFTGAIVVLRDQLHTVWTLPPEDADLQADGGASNRFGNRYLIRTGTIQTAKLYDVAKEGLGNLYGRNCIRNHCRNLVGSNFTSCTIVATTQIHMEISKDARNKVFNIQ
jgi:hypothetical protein